MGSFFFLLFKPYRNLVHWKTELTTVVLGIIIISAAVIILANLFIKYKRNNELFLHTKIFWGSILTILGFLVAMCYRNSIFLQQEGGFGAWLIFIINGLFLGVFFSYIVYAIYAISSPLRKNFIFKKMKTFFTI